MAHHVAFKIPATPLSKVDVEFVIKKDEEVLGTLHLSKGGADWYPKHAKTPHHMNWTQFANALEKDRTK